jgi:hypothetical protein
MGALESRVLIVKQMSTLITSSPVLRHSGGALLGVHIAS